MRSLVRLLPLALAAMTITGGDAQAFPHVLRKGETLASLAERFYGRVELEKILVVANGLDRGETAPLVAGMRVEIPAVAHHVAVPGDSWESVADRYLGQRRRGEALAAANDTMPWLPIPVGRELVVPYVLRYVARPGDSTPGIAYRFLEKRDDAYMLDRFNELGGDPVDPGDVVLVPLWKITLTDDGREAAKRGMSLLESEGEGEDRDAQDAATPEMVELATLVRGGRYVAAVALGSEVLGSGRLTDEQQAAVHRQLLEAYVALDEEALGRKACRAWRKLSADASLDPLELSPKIVRVCAASSLTMEGEDPP